MYSSQSQFHIEINESILQSEKKAELYVKLAVFSFAKDSPSYRI